MSLIFKLIEFFTPIKYPDVISLIADQGKDPNQFRNSVKTLLKEKGKVEAIIFVRMELNSSLPSAKKYVDQIENDLG